MEKMRKTLNLQQSPKRMANDETVSTVNRKEIGKIFQFFKEFKFVLEWELRKLEGTYCPTDEEKYRILLKRDNLLAKLRTKPTDLTKAKKLSVSCIKIVQKLHEI